MRAGGAIGEVLAALLVTDFNRTGAYIVAATGAVRRADPVDAVLLLGVPRGHGRARGRAAARAADGLGALPRDAGARRRCGGRSSASTPARARKPWAAEDPAREGGRRGASPKPRLTADAGGRPAAPGGCGGGRGPRRSSSPSWRAQRRAQPIRRRPRPEPTPRPGRAGGARRRTTPQRDSETRGSYTLPPLTILDQPKGGRTARQRPPVRAREDPAGEVRRVRRDGHGARDPPRTGGHDLRVQARRRASSTRRSSASPTTWRWRSRPSRSASTA